LNVTICNLYPDLVLTSSVYFSECTACHVPPNQQIDTGDTMKASFGIGSKQDDLEGALLYKIQGKHVDRTGNQPISNTVSDKDTNIYLLVVWNDGWKWSDYEFYVCLIACANDFTWDEDKLWTLYKKYMDKFHKNYKPNISTWLMNDGTLMKTKFNITYGSDYKLDVIISEGVWGYNTLKPLKIDPGRLVLSLLMLNVLMYTVRLSVQPSIKLNIHNQCLNFDLVSPTYVTDGCLECHRPFDYKVCAGDLTRSGFISKWDNEFYTVLIYRLQRRQRHELNEISKDTSSVSHLLVVWRLSKYNGLNADVLVVEYDEKLIWNEGDLKKLYDKNIDPFRLHPDSVTEIWSLNDSMALITISEIVNEDRIVNITISEIEKYHSMRTPIPIDLKR
jgi:hypothetical protein